MLPEYPSWLQPGMLSVPHGPWRGVLIIITYIYIYIYLDPPRDAKWMVKDAIKQPLTV